MRFSDRSAWRERKSGQLTPHTGTSRRGIRLALAQVSGHTYSVRVRQSSALPRDRFRVRGLRDVSRRNPAREPSGAADPTPVATRSCRMRKYSANGCSSRWEYCWSRWSAVVLKDWDFWFPPDGEVQRSRSSHARSKIVAAPPRARLRLRAREHKAVKSPAPAPLHAKLPSRRPRSAPCCPRWRWKLWPETAT